MQAWACDAFKIQYLTEHYFAFRNIFASLKDLCCGQIPLLSKQSFTSVAQERFEKRKFHR